MTKPSPAAAVTIKRPPEPITSRAMLRALQPLLDLLGLESADDVLSVHLTHDKVALSVVPRHRGRRQHDSRVRVVYPVVFDQDDE